MVTIKYKIIKTSVFITVIIFVFSIIWIVWVQFISSINLLWAIEKGNYGIASIMIHAGAKIDGVNEHGWTLLHFAAQDGRSDIVNLFICKGAKINVETDLPTSLSPLCVAISSKDLETVRVLLESGADPNFPNEHNESINPLTEAIRFKNVAMIDLLMQYGADPFQGRFGYRAIDLWPDVFEKYNFLESKILWDRENSRLIREFIRKTIQDRQNITK